MSNKTYAVSSYAIANHVTNYLKLFKATKDSKQKYKLEVHDIINLIVVKHMTFPVSDELLNICGKKKFKCTITVWKNIRTGTILHAQSLKGYILTADDMY